MRRGAVALLIALVAVTTSGSVDAAPRQAGPARHALPDHCVRFAAGDAGMATSADGSLTVFLEGWTFADDTGGHHGLDYRAWGPHTMARWAGTDFGAWRGFSVAPVTAVEFCGTGPGGAPIRV